MAFDYPSSPTVGQLYVPAGGGPTYQWNGYAWAVVNSATGGLSQQVFTATAGQTSFTLTLPYVPGLLDVFHNGVKLVINVDYTASTGTTVVLTNAAAVGDTIQTIAYAAVTAVNSYTKAEVDALFAASPQNGSAFRAYQPGQGTFVNNTAFNFKPTGIDFDVDGSYNATTGRFTPKVAGIYHVNACFQFRVTTGFVNVATIAINKNGTTVSQGNYNTGDNASYDYIADPIVSDLVAMNGTTDYIEISCLCGASGTLITGQTGFNQYCWWSAAFVRKYP
jgi:hypothetical protein